MDIWKKWKLVKTYFKDKDCLNLVRSLMGDQLQSFEKLSFEEL